MSFHHVSSWSWVSIKKPPHDALFLKLGREILDEIQEPSSNLCHKTSLTVTFQFFILTNIVLLFADFTIFFPCWPLSYLNLSNIWDQFFKSCEALFVPIEALIAPLS